MIIRQNIECETCHHVHTARIGIGQGVVQKHLFFCKGCQEEIFIILNMPNPPKISFEFINAVQAENDGEIINLDSDFVVNPKHMGVDRLQNRVSQMRDLLIAQMKEAEKADGQKIGFESFLSDGPMTPYDKEWSMLKKAWSLDRNSKDDLSKAQINQANNIIYTVSPLDDINDWLWRFSTRLGGAHYNSKFEVIMNEIKLAQSQKDFNAFMGYFKCVLHSEHQNVYFNVMNEFFHSYSNFSSLLYRCQVGLDIPDDFEVSTKDFNAVRMVYGNFYEAATTLVQTFACLNNVITGRNYDAFETMDLEKYKSLDKSGRTNPFKDNKALYELFEEIDNQIRNASHHGSIKLAASSGEVVYISGKGGVGPEKRIQYSEYLHSIVRLFLSIMTMMRVEIVLKSHF